MSTKEVSQGLNSQSFDLKKLNYLDLAQNTQLQGHPPHSTKI